jgi:gliding motility-associated-like protein
MILVATPSGGTFSGNGVTGNIFNPLNAGTGLHQISYSYGSGSCLTTTSQYIIIGDTLSVELIAQTDTICHLDGLDIEAIATGGIPANYHYSWNHGLSAQSNHYVYPSSTTLYTVTITDACSQDSYDSTLIYVHPGISAYITTTDTLCYGEIGSAKAIMNSTGNYQYEWSTEPTSVDSFINAPVGLTYSVTITDASSGCAIIMDEEIPSYDKIQAYFMISPDGCVPSYDAQVDLIDLSQGALNGLWDMGDGSSEAYEQLNNPRHTFSDTGIYLVSLYIINEGGCTDSVTREVCVEAVSRFFIPNAFTPNGDGINDEFKVISHGVTEFDMQIFNRWGEILFQTKDSDTGWDGTYDGKVAPQGTYIFRLEYKLIDKTYYKPHIERGYFILLNDKEKK